MSRAYYKVLTLTFPLIFTQMIEGAYSMNEEDLRDRIKSRTQEEGKVFVRKGFKPAVEPETKHQRSIPTLLPEKGDLKFDEERKMYYYGRSLSEVTPQERRVVSEDNSKEVFLLEPKEY